MLVDARQDAVGDELSVFIPVGPVFFRAAFIIAVAAIDEQDGKENKVKVGQGGIKQRR
jgi:hypothetical protein